MENGVDIPRLARWLREQAGSPPPPRRFLALALGSLLLLSGCGSGGHPDPRPASLVVGRRAAPIPRAQLAAAARTARRFATAYARFAYSRRPPSLPGATPAVERAVREGAARVPGTRRGRRPRLAALELRPAGRRAVDAGARIVDGVSPPFEVGFGLRETPAGWRVVSISLPG
ncbi:MAG: hypothetical protein U0R71_03715 [Solirubrobacterales bacterium]